MELVWEMVLVASAVLMGSQWAPHGITLIMCQTPPKYLVWMKFNLIFIIPIFTN